MWTYGGGSVENAALKGQGVGLAPVPVSWHSLASSWRLWFFSPWASTEFVLQPSCKLPPKTPLGAKVARVSFQIFKLKRYRSLLFFSTVICLGWGSVISQVDHCNSLLPGSLPPRPHPSCSSLLQPALLGHQSQLQFRLGCSWHQTLQWLSITLRRKPQSLTLVTSILNLTSHHLLPHSSCRSPTDTPLHWYYSHFWAFVLLGLLDLKSSFVARDTKKFVYLKSIFNQTACIFVC